MIPEHAVKEAAQGKRDRPRKFDTKFDRGESLGPAPYGYKNVEVVVNGKRSHVAWEIEPAVVSTITRIFELARDGHGYKGIAKILNDDGIPSPGGKNWSKPTVYQVLHREAYVGRVVYGKIGNAYKGGTLVKTVQPESEWKRRTDERLKIITDELWSAAHERLNATAAHYLRTTGGKLDGRPESASKYLLSGFCRCGKCGGAMFLHHAGTTAAAYRCSWHHQRGNKVCDNRRSIPQAELEGKILALIDGEILNENAIERTLAAERGDSAEDIAARRCAAEARRAAAQSEIDRTVKLVVKGLLSEDEVAAALKEPRATVAHADAILAALDAKVAAAQIDRDEVQATMKDWIEKLRGNPVVARQILKRLIRAHRDRTHGRLPRGSVVWPSVRHRDG